MNERNYLMIRAMSSNPNDFKIFFDNSVVAIGWSEVNFTKYNTDQQQMLFDDIKKIYLNSKDISPQVVGRNLNQIKRFLNIKKDDYIVVPYYNYIRFAVAEDLVVYNADAYQNDLANQRKVNYIKFNNDYKTIPRNDLSEAFQRRLRVRGSIVADMKEFKEEIDKIFNNECYSWSSDFLEKENILRNKFKENILKHIREGKTNLKTGGIGLEILIKELLECEGYNSEILPKKTSCDGDADISATNILNIKILVQVKHHQGYTDDWGIKQLYDYKQNEKYKDYNKYILITTANIDAKVKQKGKELDIETMNGDELIEWLIENLRYLKDETKNKLGISTLPQLIN